MSIKEVVNQEKEGGTLAEEPKDKGLKTEHFGPAALDDGARRKRGRSVG